MKYIILLLFMVVLTHLCYAQEFAPLNAEWHFQKWTLNDDYIVEYYSAKAERDTVINGNYATILTNKRNGTIMPDAEIILSEDNGKVYFFESNSFKLLYDFTLSVGDTLTFSVPQNYYYYDISCGDNPGSSMLNRAQVKIDSIIPVMFENQLLDVFYTTSIYDNSGSYFSWELGPVVERIGSYGGLFGFSTSQCLGGEWGHFRCYSDSLLTYYLSVEDCNYTTTGINNVADKLPVSVYPNPATNYFTVETSFEGIYQLQDLTGKVLLSGLATGETKFSIDISALSKGIYLLSLIDGEQQVNRKVVKE
jgi:hypothetical protein